MSRKIPPVVSAREAVSVIGDGSTVLVAGFAVCGVATALHEALRERFLESGSPKGITYIHPAGQIPGAGLDLLLEPGLLARVIGGHWGLMRKVTDGIQESPVEFHNWPQGVVVSAGRAAARGEDAGYLTRIGLGTFVDPEIEGACSNAAARRAGTLIEKVEVRGTPMLRFPIPKPHAVLLRGWSADEHGNVSCAKEAFFQSIRNCALAARRCGGKVLCQVRERERRVFSPGEIDLPGFLVDYLVMPDDPEKQHRQVATKDYDPALTGRSNHSETLLPPVPDGPRGWIGRRASMEIGAGEILNLGIGIPGDTVGPALEEQGRREAVVSTIESGVIGGIALGGWDFGAALLPETRIQPDEMFDLYYGGNLDITIMGAAEVDGNGNVNVSSFGGRTVGCGGFIDITQSARRVVFCSPLTAGGLEIEYRDGRVRVAREGSGRKLVRAVQQATFSAATSRALGQEVMLVTERAVFRLEERGWVLLELAPGVDADRDLRPHIEFDFEVARELRPMPVECFR